jgi:hypothetical protein
MNDLKFKDYEEKYKSFTIIVIKLKTEIIEEISNKYKQLLDKVSNLTFNINIK